MNKTLIQILNGLGIIATLNLGFWGIVATQQVDDALTPLLVVSVIVILIGFIASIIYVAKSK